MGGPTIHGNASETNESWQGLQFFSIFFIVQNFNLGFPGQKKIVGHLGVAVPTSTYPVRKCNIKAFSKHVCQITDRVILTLKAFKAQS